MMWTIVVALVMASQAAASQPPKPRPQPARGKWEVGRKTSLVDDRTTVFISLRAERSTLSWPGHSDTPLLVLRCTAYEGELPHVEALFALGSQLEHSTMTLRFDQEMPLELPMDESTSGEGLLFGDGRAAIRNLLGHKRLAIRFTPYKSSPQETIFMLGGLDHAVKELLAGCAWDPAGEERAHAEAEAALEAEAQIAAEKRRAAAKVKFGQLLDSLSSGSNFDRGLAAARIAMFAQTGTLPGYGTVPADDIPFADAVPALIRALADQELAVRESAVNALGAIGAAAQPALVALEVMAEDQKNPTRFSAKTAAKAIRAHLQADPSVPPKP
jgi:hypothetical protein